MIIPTALLLLLQGPLAAHAASGLRGLAAITTSNTCDPSRQLAFAETPCLVRFTPEIEDTTCTGSDLRRRLAQAFDSIANECEWDSEYELLLITRTLSFDKANRVLDALCGRAQVERLAQAPTSQWTDIDAQFTDSFMNDYSDGGTFLNRESQQDTYSRVP